MATVNSSKFNIVVNRTTSTVTSQVNSNKFNIAVNRANGENELGVNGKANTQVIIYKGGVQLTPVNSTPKDGQFKISIDSVQGCTAAIKNNDTVYINTLTEDTGTVIINITLPNGNVIKKYFTVQKSVALSSVKDIETRVTSAEQKITDKAITSVVKESQFIKDMNGKITTNTSNISEVEQTASSINSKVTALDGKYSEIKQTADSINSKVTNLDGKYTEIKQTIDGIDLTGKVSFSDLSTAGKTTINGANIDTTNLVVRGQLISGQINGVGGIKFADGAVISSYDSHIAGVKGIRVSAPSIKLGDEVEISRPTISYDVKGKSSSSSSTTTWTMTGAGALTCASASLSKTLGVSGQANIGSVVTNRIDVYGNSNLDGTAYVSGACTIGSELNVKNKAIYGMNNIALARGTVYLPQGGGNNTTDYLRIGGGFMAGVDSGNFHFLNRNGGVARIYAGNVSTAYSLEPIAKSSNRSVFDEINSIKVIDTAEGFRLINNPAKALSEEDTTTSRAVYTTYNEKTEQEEVNIDYTTAISTLWKAVQELKSENEELKNEVKILSRIDASE